MIQVTIDGDPLMFNEPRPETVDELVTFVGKFLFENGRVIKSVIVDGEDATLNGQLLSKRNYVNVKFTSTGIKEDMLDEIAQLMKNKDKIINFMHEFSVDVLTTEWVFNAKDSEKLSFITLTIVLLLNRTRALMQNGNEELLNELQLLSSVFCQGKNLYTSAVSFNDPHCVSDVIINQIIPSVVRALDLLEGPVKSYFESISSENGLLVF